MKDKNTIETRREARIVMAEATKNLSEIELMSGGTIALYITNALTNAGFVIVKRTQ